MFVAILMCFNLLVEKKHVHCIPTLVYMRVEAVTIQETGLVFFCACAYNHVALLFNNKVGGSRRGLSTTSRLYIGLAVRLHVFSTIAIFSLVFNLFYLCREKPQEESDWTDSLYVE